MSKNLPSYRDFLENDDENLPSVEQFMANEGELPSVEDLANLEEEVVEEEQIIQEFEVEADGKNIISGAELIEVVKLINDVRKSIPQVPEIPEIKYYDEELEKLTSRIEEIKESIPEVPVIKDYDHEIAALKDTVEGYPEVKYYDEEIQELRENIPEVPEVKYYDDQIEELKESLERVKDSIPELPDLNWINKLAPNYDWVTTALSNFEHDLSEHKINISDQVEETIQNLNTTLEKSEFESKTDIKNIDAKFESTVKETKDKIWNELSSFSTRVWETKKELLKSQKELTEDLQGKLDKSNTELGEDISGKVGELLKYIKEVEKNVDTNTSTIIGLPKPKYYDEELEEIKKDVLDLQSLKTIVEEIKEKQTDYLITLNEVYNDRPIGPDPEEKQGQDPLTPTDQQFATLKDLAANYRLFVNRVEQQLYTIGGGGAGYLKDLNDVNITGLENDYILVWNASTNMWDVAENAGGGGSGIGGTWASNSIGVNTTSNVGIATTTADSSYALAVTGDVLITGDLVGLGTIIYEDKKYLDVVGLATFNDGIIVKSGVSTFTTGVGTIHVGYGQTALLVDGDARVTGILTIGTGSVTIDGDNNTVTAGIVTLTNSTIILGDNITLQAGATGINSAPNVFYVAKDGSDDNNGTSIDNAFLTISGAVGIATSGATIKVLSGKYTESNAIEIPAYVSIVGDDQRTVTVSPSTTTDDLFHVRKGCKLSNMTFSGHLHPAAAVGFPTTEIAENVGGGKWKGPYVQNCTSDTSTGIGIRIDGDQARSLKAMNVDAFTQYNQGGVGVAVTNDGFAQLVSLFTICCNEAVTCDKGGQADIANSNCSFGTYGLVARGVSDLQYTGVVTSSAAAAQDNVVVNINVDALNVSNFVYTHTTGVATVTTSAAHGFAVGMGVTLSGLGLTCTYGTKTYPYQTPYVFTIDSLPSTTSFVVNVGISTVAHTYVSGGTAKLDVDRPYDGQSVYFDTLYKQVQSITVGSGGTGYTSTPTVTIASGDGETATAYATLEDESVSSITIISSGNQYSSTPAVTIGAPNVGVNTATATAVMTPIYYTINSSTPVSSGISTLKLEENLIAAVGVGSTAYFARTSKIVASSHTFEYVGSGNKIVTAAPQRGGVTVQANEVVTSDGGRVLYTSTDQAGNFRIGDDLQINQSTGTVSGRAFTKSLFSEMTPFILALS